MEWVFVYAYMIHLSVKSAHQSASFSMSICTAGT